MARIRQVRRVLSESLFDVIQVSTESLPGVDVILYEKVTRLAAEKYDKVLRRITPKIMKESVAKFAGISFVSRKPFEARVLIVDVKGRIVTFWFVFDLYGPTGEIGLFFHHLFKGLPARSGIWVENEIFAGEVELPRGPTQVTILKTRRVTYFLSDKEQSPEHLPVATKIAPAAR